MNYSIANFKTGKREFMSSARMRNNPVDKRAASFAMSASWEDGAGPLELQPQNPGMAMSQQADGIRSSSSQTYSQPQFSQAPVNIASFSQMSTQTSVGSSSRNFLEAFMSRSPIITRLDNEPGASAERAGSKLAMAKSQQRQPPEHERMQGVSSSALEMGQRDMRLREYRDVLESFAEQTRDFEGIAQQLKASMEPNRLGEFLANVRRQLDGLSASVRDTLSQAVVDSARMQQAESILCAQNKQIDMLEGQLRASEARESRYLAMLEKAVIDTQPKQPLPGLRGIADGREHEDGNTETSIQPVFVKDAPARNSEPSTPDHPDPSGARAEMRKTGQTDNGPSTAQEVPQSDDFMDMALFESDTGEEEEGVSTAVSVTDAVPIIQHRQVVLETLPARAPTPRLASAPGQIVHGAKSLKRTLLASGEDESKEVLRRMRLEAEMCASPDTH